MKIKLYSEIHAATYTFGSFEEFLEADIGYSFLQSKEIFILDEMITGDVAQFTALPDVKSETGGALFAFRNIKQFNTFHAKNAKYFAENQAENISMYHAAGFITAVEPYLKDMRLVSLANLKAALK